MKTLYTLLITACIGLTGCTGDSDNAIIFNDGNSVSQGGSTAKFTAFGNHLYVIEQTTLKTYDISDENEIVVVHSLVLNTIQLETIFSFSDKLFLGSTTGVLIIDISNPALPRFLSDYQHVLSCDPVVTDSDFAYVTLRSGNFCGQSDDELQILDLSDINNPNLIASYGLTNPKGLAINNNTLYVCDDGVRILDVSDKNDIREINFISNIPANDVIYYNNQILVTADDGFYQFDVSNITNVKQIGQFNF